VQRTACTALGVLLLDDSNKEVAMDMGIITYITAGMQNHPDNVDIQMEACEVLRNLTVAENGSAIPVNQRAIVQQGVLPLVFKVMEAHRDNADVQVDALKLFVNLTSAADRRCLDVVRENMEKLEIETDTLITMEKHLMHEQVQLHALSLIHHLTSEADQRTAELWRRKGAVPLIRKAINNHAHYCETIKDIASELAHTFNF